MKKLIKVCLFVLVVLMLAACSGGGSGNNNGGTGGAKKIADDLDVIALHFAAPSEFESVERYCESTVDGKLIEKDIAYNLANGETITYAAMPETLLSDLTSLDTFEQIEVNGFTVYRYNSGNDIMAFIQNGNDLYAIDYNMTTPDDGTALKEILGNVSFTKNTTTITDKGDFDEVNYTFDDSHKVYDVSTRIVEDPDGKMQEKTVYWSFGESDENQDFRFYIHVYKNSTYDQVLSESKTYEDKEINGITFKALVNDDGSPTYEYDAEHNGDVYIFRNSGVSNGWFGVTRSDESNTYFDKFINSVSFK